MENNGFILKERSWSVFQVKTAYEIKIEILSIERR